MNANVTVHTLKANSAYLHVDDDVYGCVKVWGSCYGQPTFLIKDGQSFELLVFDNEECASEYFESAAGLVNVEVIRISHDKDIQEQDA